MTRTLDKLEHVKT